MFGRSSMLHDEFANKNRLKNWLNIAVKIRHPAQVFRTEDRKVVKMAVVLSLIVMLLTDKAESHNVNGHLILSSIFVRFQLVKLVSSEFELFQTEPFGSATERDG
jgi:hypothetical protein